MKKIFCELCDGIDFIKEGGMFICQGCGTKYTAEEARAMMREVDGDMPVPVVASAPIPSAVPNGNQAQIDNLLLLANNAYDAGNNEEAESYCNRVIELEAVNYKAWFLKGKAIGWSSKLAKNRMEEAAHSFCQAIDFAPEEEKEELKTLAVDELKKLGLACIKLRKDNFSGDPTTSNYNGFNNDRIILIKSLTVLLSHGNIVGIPDGYLEEIASMMNNAAVAALNMARKAWEKVEHPNKNDLTTYLDWNGNICALLRDAIKASDEDDEDDIVRYENLNVALDDPIGRYSYKREWVSYASEYRWMQDLTLSDSAVKSRKDEINRNKAAIARIKRKAADKKAAEERKANEEKQARIAAYWAEHKEEKAKLDAEKEDLRKKRDSLNAKIRELKDRIAKIERDGKVKTPSEKELADVKGKINALEGQKASLGLFAMKEKKRIAEEIAALEATVSSIEANITKEKKAQSDAIAEKVKPLKAEISALEKEKTAFNNRIAAIDEILTQDR